MPNLEVSFECMPDMSRRWLPIQRMLQNNRKVFAEEIIQVAHRPQRHDREQLRPFVLDRYSKQAVTDVVKEAYVNAITQNGKIICANSDPV